MLDETVDTIAIFMATYTLEQTEKYLRDNSQTIEADKIRKLQIDAGYQHQAISEGFDDVRKLEACSPEIQRDIENFEPVTHERLKILKDICIRLPDGDLKNDLQILSNELTQNPLPAPSVAGPSGKSIPSTFR